MATNQSFYVDKNEGIVRKDIECEFRRFLQNILDHPASLNATNRIFAIHGLPGSGKSLCLKHLSSVLKRDYHGIHDLYLDFSDSRNNDPLLLVRSLRDQLDTKVQNAQFQNLDVCEVAYEEARKGWPTEKTLKGFTLSLNPQTPNWFEKLEEWFIERNRRSAVARLKKKNKAASKPVLNWEKRYRERIAHCPWWVIKVVQGSVQFYELGKPLFDKLLYVFFLPYRVFKGFNDGIDKSRETHYTLSLLRAAKQYKKNSAFDIYSFIPAKFSQDLNILTTTLKKPIVIFVDSFEQIEPSANESLGLRNPEGQSLATLTTDVLWVVASEVKLNEKLFSKNFKQIPLKRIPQGIAREYFKSRNIQDKETIDHFIKISQGHPQAMFLYAQRYNQLAPLGKGGEALQYRSVEDILKKNIFGLLSPQEVETLHILACLREWDHDMWTFFVENQGLSNNVYKSLAEKYIRDLGHGYSSLFKQIRNIVIDNLTVQTRQQVYMLAIDYLRTTLENSQDKLYEQGRGCEAAQIFTLGQLIHYYMELLTLHLKARKNSSLTLSVEYVRRIQRDAVNYSACGRTQEALPLFELLLKIHRANHAKEADVETMTAIGVSQSILAKSLPKSEQPRQYALAIRTLQAAHERGTAQLGKDHPFTIQALHSLAVNYSKIKDYEHAKELLLAFKDAPCTLGNSKARFILGIAYNALGETQQAIRILTEVLAFRETTNKTSYLTLDTKDALAKAYLNAGDKLKALELTKAAYKTATENYSEDSYIVKKLSFTLKTIRGDSVA